MPFRHVWVLAKRATVAQTDSRFDRAGLVWQQTGLLVPVDKRSSLLLLKYLYVDDMHSLAACSCNMHLWKRRKCRC